MTRNILFSRHYDPLRANMTQNLEATMIHYELLQATMTKSTLISRHYDYYWHWHYYYYHYFYSFFFFLVFVTFFFSENEKLKYEKRKKLFETFYNRLLLLLDCINQIVLRRLSFLVLALLCKICPVLRTLVFPIKYWSHIYKCL